MTTRGDHAYFAGLMDLKFTVRGEQTKLLLAMQTPKFELADYVASATGQSILEVPSMSFDRRPCTIHCKTAHQHVITGLSYRVQIPTTKAAIIIHNTSSYLLRRDTFMPYLRRFETWFLNSPEVTGQMLAAAERAMTDMRAFRWDIPLHWWQRVTQEVDA